MNKYNVIPLETDDHDFIWCVVESQTDQLIESFPFEDEAEESAKFMENGGAFAGWTPTFMLTEIEASITVDNLNQKFDVMYEDYLMGNWGNKDGEFA
jgi:hypothetical protein